MITKSHKVETVTGLMHSGRSALVRTLTGHNNLEQSKLLNPVMAKLQLALLSLTTLDQLYLTEQIKSWQIRSHLLVFLVSWQLMIGSDKTADPLH
jgi:hypothetical protein